jgi:predicted amidohydrolase YtcJ
VITIRRTIYASLLPALAACQPQAPTPDAAERVLMNGAIYTINEAQPRAEAVAISDGRFIAVGSNDEIGAFISDRTEVTDLEGRMAMPGMFDIHIHPTDGAMAQLYDCSFPFTSTVEQILDIVAACVADAEPGEWIRGGQWGVELATLNDSINASMLDPIAPNNPVFLIDSTVHNAWVNTAALERLGIDDDTPDPAGGSIVRDDAGVATGILIDDGAYNAMAQLPDYTAEQYETALEWTANRLNQYGVTGFKDAIAEAGSLAAYRELDQSGRLNARVAASLIWKRAWQQSEEDHRKNIEQREQYRTDRVNPDFIKIFLDGIPPSGTAYMIEPYETSGGFAHGHRGIPLHDSETLAEDVTRFDALGLTVKMHAVGDAALRQGLDAIEAARSANGPSGLRHEISHAGIMHADDIPRFAQLDAVPELAPILWYPIPGLAEAQRAAIGPERADDSFPIRSLIASGAEPAYGSDWPAVVPTPNPWPGVEAMITRRDPYADEPGEAKWAEQAIGLEATLRVFTINGAKALKLDDIAGSIEVGKSADLIVLNQNLFEIPATDIADTIVLETILEGQTVATAN